MIPRTPDNLRRLWSPVWVGFVGILLAGIFALLDSSVFGLELRTLDLRFQLRGPLSLEHSPVVIVQVDNRTYKDLDARWPFSRAWHARLLRNLRAAGARTVIFDIMFTESASEDPEGDLELAAALAEADDTILSGEMITESARGGTRYTRVDPPLPILLAGGTDWGLVDDIKDRDRINRRYNLYQPLKDELLPTIGTRLIMKLEGVDHLSEPEGKELVIGSCRIPLSRDLKNIMRINYYGPTGSFPTYRFSSILDDADFDLADPDMDTDYMEMMKNPELFAAFFGDDAVNPFKDKLVLVGVSADDLHDNKMTPWYGYGDSAHEMPGVETHAHAIQTMLDRSFITRSSANQDRLLVALAGLAGGLAILWLGPLPSLLVLLVLAAAWAFTCLKAFTGFNHWLPLLAPLVALAGAWTAGVLQQFLRARRERQEVRAIFS
ncbi:MAG: CHASE2 domain-containing protein, partial [Calditrichaeota bacterium]|nr:CHASE2 domain-containing protein [Calditrichota bacterium]